MANHPNVRLLRITNNENNSYSNGTGSSMKFISNDPDLHGINRIHLKTSIIPNTQYNINTKNNKLTLICDDMKTIEAIPVGQYTTTTFIEALKIVLDVAAFPNTFNIIVDPLTYKIKLTKSGGNNFTIPDKSLNKMYLVIGQDILKTSILTMDGLEIACDNIYNLSGLRHVYVESYTLGKSLLTGSVKKYATVADIPITVPFGSFQCDVYTEETLNVVYYKGFKNISSFHLKLVDEYGEEVELNGATFAFVFEIHSS